MSAKRIVIIEKQKTLGRFIEDYFATRGPDYFVLSASSISQALTISQEQMVDLVVLDAADSADGDPSELLGRFRKFNPSARGIFCAGRNAEQDMERVLQSGFEAVFIKPIPMPKFCDLVFSMLQSERGFSGRLIGMKLEDVIEMLCYRKDSSLLSISHADNSGRVFVHQGEIIHAQCDGLIGVEALFEVLGWEKGEFMCQPLLELPDQTVFMDWQSLLMEGIRQKDEIHYALSTEHATDLRASGSATARGVGVKAETRDLRRIMIVDDSRFIRKIVQEIIQSDPELQVAGYATNGQEALAKIDELKPDLILLDWDMPVMMGSTALMHIMIRSPCPVVILSGFVGGEGASPFDLLCLGAVDFLRKPQSKWRTDGRADDLVRRVKQACEIKPERFRRLRIPQQVQRSPGRPGAEAESTFLTAFCSSTGGGSDLIRFVPSLPADIPCAVIVLHDMQQETVAVFVEYLDKRSQVEVRMAEAGTRPVDGVCYVHPSTVPIELVGQAGKPCLDMPELPGKVHVIDHFLASAAKVMGSNLLAGLFSGGPGPGIEGLRYVRQAGGITVVQEPDLSVDPRMVEEALREGIVDYRCSVDNLGEIFHRIDRMSAERLSTPM